MASMVALMGKLQKALMYSGDIVKINTKQYYSKDKERMINCYIVTKAFPTKCKDGTIKNKDKQIFMAYSALDVVKFLSERYKGGE